MSAELGDEASVLRLTLHGRLVGYMAGFKNGRNVLSFAEEFKADPHRPTFSLITHPSFPRAEKFGVPWRAIKPHFDDTMERARALWPEALKNLPMNEAHKDSLKAHWGKLQRDFKIETTQ